ncbi:MAG: hypothetical protein COA67_01285 [Lutibacter sp.]|nr:MAG: hypothetical protein COA67_01285 [Lutibacter sp.]
MFYSLYERSFFSFGTLFGNIASISGSRKATRVDITLNHTIMKKGILLLLTMLLLVSTVEAKNGERTNYRTGYMSIYDAEPIQFVERGIKFYVFLDGEFDFNTKPNRHTQTDYLYKTSRRSTRVRSNRGVRIDRDYKGRIRRIGNVFINYNRYGKVRRIGKVFVDYRHRKMSNVGNLRVIYNHRGKVRYIGNVKRHTYGYGYYNDYNSWNYWEYDYDDDFFFKSNFHNQYESYNEDDNFLYYRSKGVKKGVKGKIIKRKKKVLKPKIRRKGKRG